MIWERWNFPASHKEGLFIFDEINDFGLVEKQWVISPETGKIESRKTGERIELCSQQSLTSWLVEPSGTVLIPISGPLGILLVRVNVTQ